MDKSILKKRFYAFFIDLSLVDMAMLLIELKYYNYISTFFVNLNRPVLSGLKNGMYKVELLSFLTIYFGYFLVSYLLTPNSTVGKRVMGLKIFGKDNSNPSFNQIFIRSLTGTISLALLGLPYLVNLFNKKGRGFTDWFSQTYVDSNEKKQEILPVIICPVVSIQQNHNLDKDKAA